MSEIELGYRVVIAITEPWLCRPTSNHIEPTQCKGIARPKDPPPKSLLALRPLYKKAGKKDIRGRTLEQTATSQKKERR